MSLHPAQHRTQDPTLRPTLRPTAQRTPRHRAAALLARAVLATGVSAVFALASAPAQAQDFPNRAVRIIVPSTPGGSLDLSGRIIGGKLQDRFRQPVVVENRPGGNTMVGSVAVANAAPDGYSLLVQDPAFVHSVLYKDPQIDVLKALTPVGPVYSGRALVFTVSAATPAKTVAEFIAYTKANPGKLNYGTAQGVSTLVMEAFAQIAGFTIQKIEYKGSTQALTALLANEVQASISNPTTAVQHAQTGRVRILAVAGDKRQSNLPNVPTLAEVGYPQLKAAVLVAMFAPSATPAAVIDRLYPAIREAVASPEMEKAFEDAGAPLNVDRPELIRLINAEIDGFIELARIGKYRPQ